MIVGRVICEEGDDPSRVVAQMPIQSEGYFAGPVDDSHRPVGFRRQGYFPIQITPSGEPGSVEYVGEVRLKRMPKTMASAVRGKIVLEGEIPARRSQQSFDSCRPDQLAIDTVLKEYLAIPAMQQCPARLSSPRQVCHRLITRSPSRRQATWASGVGFA